MFTVDGQPLRDRPPGRVVTRLATIVARVLRPERLEGQHAVVIVHPGNRGGRAQRTAGVVLGPRDGQRQVATDHRARDAGPFAHVHRPFRQQRAEPRRHCNLQFRCSTARGHGRASAFTAGLFVLRATVFSLFRQLRFP